MTTLALGENPLFDGLGSPIDGLPLSFPDHVRQLIEADIVAGGLAPDERVTETGLAERFGVSRTPVREAMRLLESQGLIVRPRGRSAYVASRTTLSEAQALYELRMSLEGYLTERATTRIADPELQILRALERDFTALVDGGDKNVRGLMMLDSDFHWTIYNAADTGLTTIVSSYWARVQRELYARVYTSMDPGLFASQHGLLIDALASGDGQRARHLMTEHIGAGAKAIAVSFGQ
jgi:DNA-binding GntR family transcriptional regulator